METRRTFLGSLVLIGVSSGLAGDALRAQQPQKPELIPPPKSKSGQESDTDATIPPSLDKKILESRDKEMKKKVEQLYKLATSLKEEVEKTDSSKVLNLELTRRAEEIERLARDIKNRAKE